MNTYATRILKKQQKLEKLKADILKKEAMRKAITDEIAKLNSMQYKKWYATLQKEISENIDDLHLDAIPPEDVLAFLIVRSKSYDKANEESSNNEKERKDEGEEDGANKEFEKNTDEHQKVQDENSKQDDTPSIEATEEKPKKEEAVSQDAGIWTAPESF